MRKIILFPNFTNTEEADEYIHDTFGWSLKGSPAFRPNPLPEDCHDLYPGFVFDVVTSYAHDSNISEMVQAIIYAMVPNDTVEPGLLCRIDMNCIMSILHRLH